MTTRNYAEEVAAFIIEGLKNGTSPWIKPWEPGDSHSPQNPVTQKNYRGINMIHLMAKASANGFNDPRWLTYKQAATLGAQVKEGEKSTQIQYWQWHEMQDIKNEQGEVLLDDKGKPQKRKVALEHPRLFTAHVFNAEQIDGLQPFVKKETALEPNIEAAETLLHAGNPIIHYTQDDRCFYSPKNDSITMVARENFTNLIAFYQTGLHEKAHWSGHAERLNRDLSHPFGSEGHAKEELRAEICSLMLGQALGIGFEPGPHLSYIQSWIKVLEDDPKEIFRAARDAEKMKSYLFELAQIQEITLEPVILSSSQTNVNNASSDTISFESVVTDSLTRLYVPYAEKDEAKALGAKWDLQNKYWYVEKDMALEPFSRWAAPQTQEASIKEVLSPEDKKAIEQSVSDEQQKRLDEEKKLAEKTANKAKQLLETARKEPPLYRHPFFDHVNIAPEMIPPVFVDKDNHGLISIADNQGNIKSLQRLSPEGLATLLSYTEVEGCYHAVNHLKGKVESKLEGQPIIVTKDYTTALVLHHELGAPVAVAFLEDNLLPVAKALKEGIPEATIYVASEKSRFPHQKVLEELVTNAASAVDGVAISPSFLKGVKGQNWQTFLAQDKEAFHAQVNQTIASEKIRTTYLKEKASSAHQQEKSSLSRE
jgi:antirestriction protein ArdC/phage/plasmid primase-like uncharacterized protein